jgi:hypothetical protein
MKKIIIILFGTIFLLVQLSAIAQDSTKHGAIKQITKTNGQADNLKGKEIQKQSLSNNKFTKPDTNAAGKPIKKTRTKNKRKFS